MAFHANRRARLSMAAFLLALAAGCGGGGGTPGDPAVPPAPPPPPAAKPLNFGVHPSAAVVLGQSGFETMEAGSALDQLSFPMASAVTEDGRLIVADGRNDVLKTFSNYDATATGRAADFESNLGDHNVASAGGRVVTAIGSNIRIFNQWPTAPGSVEADVTSSSTFGCGRTGLSEVAAAHLTPMGRLIVADRGNHRVLIWNSIPSSGELGPAEIVIGQSNMDWCNENGSAEEGTRGPTSRAVLSSPRSVWSDDARLIVSDYGNNRVLIWDTFPGSSQEPDHVVGQADFAGSDPNAGEGGPKSYTLNEPRSVDVNEHGQLAVADAGNNRVLIWNSIPRTDGKAADQVIGQSSFENSGVGSPSAQSIFLPYQARFHKRNLIVSEPERNRVMIWRSQD